MADTPPLKNAEPEWTVIDGRYLDQLIDHISDGTDEVAAGILLHIEADRMTGRNVGHRLAAALEAQDGHRELHGEYGAPDLIYDAYPGLADAFTDTVRQAVNSGLIDVNRYQGGDLDDALDGFGLVIIPATKDTP